MLLLTRQANARTTKKNIARRVLKIFLMCLRTTLIYIYMYIYIYIKVVLKHMRKFFISFKLLPLEFVPLGLNVSKIKFQLICSIFTGVAGLSKF